MDLPALVFPPDPSLPPVPDEAACVRLWDKYGMLPNIRAHSRTVARWLWTWRNGPWPSGILWMCLR